MARRAQCQWCVAAAVMRVQGALLVLGLLAGAGLIWLRQSESGMERTLWQGLGVVVAVVGLEGLIVSWRRRPSVAEMLVRLEVVGRFHGQLLAAQAGKAPWPDCPRSFGAGWRWRWSACWLRPLLAVSALMLGSWWPVSSMRAPLVMTEPPTWQMTQQELQQLVQEQWIDPVSVAPVLEQIDQWRAQPTEQWLQPAALEASDALLREHQQATAQWQQQIEQIQQAAQTLEQQADAASPTAIQRAVQQWQEAIEAMDAAQLRPHADLRQQLQQLDPSRHEIDPQRMRELGDKLRQNAQLMKKMQQQRQGSAWGEKLNEQGLTAKEAQEWADKNASDRQAQARAGDEGGERGRTPGSGGVSEGGGHSSAPLGAPRAPLQLGEGKNLQNDDDRHVAQGDLLQIERQQHERSLAPLSMQDGGSAATSRGGERVWQEHLNPDEQRSLKRFFNAE